MRDLVKSDASRGGRNRVAAPFRKHSGPVVFRIQPSRVSKVRRIAEVLYPLLLPKESKHSDRRDRRLQEASEPNHTSPHGRTSSAVVITRPPEILAVFHIPTQSSKCPSLFVVFDSHPRPNKGAKGASFIFFPTLEAANQYISGLLQVDPSLQSSRMQWQAQLLGHYSGHFFSARTHSDVDANPMRHVYDANMHVLELKSRLADAEERIRTLSSDNSFLHKRLSELEGKLPQRLSPSSPQRNPNIWVPPPSCPPIKSSHDNSNLRIAGPSTHRKPVLGNSSRPSPSVANDSSGQSSASRERVDAALAARLHREQEKELASLELARRTQKDLDKEDSKLRSQMRRLQETSQPLFSCRICLDNHPMDYVAQIDACRHRFCRQCMRDLVSSKLKEHRYPIVCPVCLLDKDGKDPGSTFVPMNCYRLMLTSPESSPAISLNSLA